MKPLHTLLEIPYVEKTEAARVTRERETMAIKQLPVTIPVCNFKTGVWPEVKAGQVLIGKIHQVVLLESVTWKPFIKPKGAICCQQDIHVPITIPVCEAKSVRESRSGRVARTLIDIRENC